MAIKGIVMTTESVGAILEDRKGMTRRVIKPKYANTHLVSRTDKYGTQLVEMQNDVEGETFGKSPDGKTWHKLLGYIVPKPRYQPGDILWVRETWFSNDECILFKASKYEKAKSYHGRNGWVDIMWHSSRFMPRSVARIWLRVTDVRVERVQDITNNDAIKEGCAGAECDCLRIGRSWMGCESCMNTGWQEPPVVEFMQLWDDLNAKRGYSWNSNPWVWVISFERCEKPQEVSDG